MKLPAASCGVFWRRRIKTYENPPLYPNDSIHRHKAGPWGMDPHTDQNLQGTYPQALHKAVFDKGWAFGWTAGGPF
jgi:hypothetical protein